MDQPRNYERWLFCLLLVMVLRSPPCRCCEAHLIVVDILEVGVHARDVRLSLLSESERFLFITVILIIESSLEALEFKCDRNPLRLRSQLHLEEFVGDWELRLHV